eukprot:symbB.v1.2.016927.t1/scaffold1304.1/size242089/21
MENGVMPVLLQGLDALSRHVDKLASGKSDGSSSARKQKFNPLTWLAQYLLRNHPTHTSDHRDAMYRHLHDLAAVERGRRNLLRRLPEFEATWKLYSQGEGLSTSKIEEVVQHLDTLWNLEDEFVRCLPANFAARIPCTDPNKVTFNEFWEFFEEVVSSNDLLRVSVFEDAERRRQQVEQDAQDALEKARQKEANMAEEARQQSMSVECLAASPLPIEPWTLLPILPMHGGEESSDDDGNQQRQADQMAGPGSEQRPGQDDIAFESRFNMNWIEKIGLMYYAEGNFVVQHEQAANHPLLKIAQDALLKGSGELLAEFSRTYKEQETSKGRLADAITPGEFVRAANSYLDSADVPQVPVAYGGMLYLAKVSHNAEEAVSLKSKGSNQITFRHFGVHLNPLAVHVHFDLTGVGRD